jgi:HEAT repeat protein
MPSDLRALVEKTFSTDRRQRMDAARELGWLGERGVPAIPFLIRLLNDYEGYADANPSREASMALVRLGPSAVEPLIAAMRAPGNPANEELAVVLGLTGDRRAVPALIDALEGHEAGGLRDRAAWALGLIGDPRAVEPLLRHVGDDDPDVAEWSIEALGGTGDRRAVEPLIAIAKNRGAPANLRGSAAASLGKIGDPRAFEPLLAIFKNAAEPESLRYRCAHALGETKQPRAFEVLREALGDKDEYMRLWAIGALTCLHDPRTVALFKSLLHNSGEEESVQRAAAAALVDTGDPDAIEHAYRESLLDKAQWPLLRLDVLDAFAQSRNTIAYPYVVRALRDKQSAVRAEAARVLAETICLRTMRGLGGFIDFREQVRKLPALDDTRVLDALLDVVRNHSEETETRELAREALRKSGNPKALQALKEIGENGEKSNN